MAWGGLGTTGDGAIGAVGGDDGVTACQSEVCAGEAGLVREVDDDGAVAEEGAWAGGGGEVEVEVAGEIVSAFAI